MRAASRWPLPPPGAAVVRRRRAGPRAEARHRRDPRRVQELHVRRVLQEVLEQEPGPGALPGALQDLIKLAAGAHDLLRKGWDCLFGCSSSTYVLQIRSRLFCCLSLQTVASRSKKGVLVVTIARFRTRFILEAERSVGIHRIHTRTSSVTCGYQIHVVSRTILKIRIHEI